jgi:LEA14-like dessication related protein
MKTLTLSLFLIIGISSYSEKIPNSSTFTEPEVTGMENFSIERKSGKMYIGFDFIIKNPNRIGIVIKPSSIHLNIAGQDVGWVRIEEKIKIKRKSENSYPFMLVGNSGDFVKSGFSSIWSLITGNGVDFKMKGVVKAGVFFFKKKWKIDFTYKMSNDEFMSMF